MVLSSIEEVYGPQFFSEKKETNDPFVVFNSLGDNSHPSTQVDCSAMLMHIHNCPDCKNQLMAELAKNDGDGKPAIVDKIENFVAYYCASYSSYDIFLFILFVFIIWSLLQK